jgi:hypothetical protein
VGASVSQEHIASIFSVEMKITRCYNKENCTVDVKVNLVHQIYAGDQSIMYIQFVAQYHTHRVCELVIKERSSSYIRA